jgi:serine O-acetyltransferase
MTFVEYKAYVLSDLHRYNPDEHRVLKYIIMVPGFRYTFWMRTVRYFKSRHGLVSMFAYQLLAKIILKRIEYRFGISIPYNTEIGHGLYIGHYGGIVISPEAKIGKNCNLNHGVTVGSTYGGKHPGTPIIGDNVYLGPGSKVIGGIMIGNNVAIGANCVVTNSMPDNAVVVGVPGRVISEKGSFDYVVNRV